MARTYITGLHADSTFDVTSIRYNVHAWIDGTLLDHVGTERSIGDNDLFGYRITRIQFYTGFAGCPARYYVTADHEGRSVTTVHNA